MINPLGKNSRFPLTQNLEGFVYLENFLISMVTTILAVRFYLMVTGYPQIGGGGIHIAHMLWGGLLMGISLLLVLFYLDRKIRSIMAILGGIGFGLFIDELGKFITSDNNYFFQPTIALIYIVVILIYFVLVLTKKYSTISPQEYICNALDIFRDSIINGATPENENQITQYFVRAGYGINLKNLTSLFPQRVIAGNGSSNIFNSMKKKIMYASKVLTTHKLFQRMVLIYIGLQAVGTLLFLVIVIFLFASKQIPMSYIYEHQSLLSFTSIGLLCSSIGAGILALAGFFTFPFSKIRAYILFRSYLLVSIFIVQFFLFLQNQLGAVIGLFGNIIGLMALDILVKQAENISV